MRFSPSATGLYCCTIQKLITPSYEARNRPTRWIILFWLSSTPTSRSLLPGVASSCTTSRSHCFSLAGKYITRVSKYCTDTIASRSHERFIATTGRMATASTNMTTADINLWFMRHNGFQTSGLTSSVSKRSSLMRTPFVRKPAIAISRNVL
jgi:hypothetical protein